MSLYLDWNKFQECYFLPPRSYYSNWPLIPAVPPLAHSLVMDFPTFPIGQLLFLPERTLFQQIGSRPTAITTHQQGTCYQPDILEQTLIQPGKYLEILITVWAVQTRIMPVQVVQRIEPSYSNLCRFSHPQSGSPSFHKLVARQERCHLVSKVDLP